MKSPKKCQEFILKKILAESYLNINLQLSHRKIAKLT